jgi:hypothetical protein
VRQRWNQQEENAAFVSSTLKMEAALPSKTFSYRCLIGLLFDTQDAESKASERLPDHTAPHPEESTLREPRSENFCVERAIVIT